MDLTQVMRAAFDDELEKIAGELQGFVRSGRRPISVERLLEREAEDNSVDMDVDGDSEEKHASFPVKETALIGAGLYLGDRARKYKRRYEMGRQMELQNTGGF
jgi:hypothetical protein